MNVLKNILLATALGIAFGLTACGNSSGDKNDNEPSPQEEVVVDAGTDPDPAEADAGDAPDPVESDAGVEPVVADAGEDPVVDGDDAGTHEQPTVVLGAECDINAEPDFCDEDGNSVFCNCEDDECDRTIWWKKTCDKDIETCGTIQDHYGPGLDLTNCYDNELSLCTKEGEVFGSMCDDEYTSIGLIQVATCVQTSIGLRVEWMDDICISEDETKWYACDDDKWSCDFEHPIPFD